MSTNVINYTKYKGHKTTQNARCRRRREMPFQMGNFKMSLFTFAESNVVIHKYYMCN